MGEVQLKYGQKAAGLTGTPGQNPEADSIKQLSAEVIEKLNDLRTATESSEKKSMYTIAIRRIQEGSMWGNKAVYHND